jgi:hypothetical protein
MVAEERIATKFSGFVGAYGTEGEATFLSTQQVDEARHVQFYARFQDEVVAAPDLINNHVERARGRVSASFRQIFDVALVDAHEQLVGRPGDLAAKVRFVTLYDLVLESTLGLTTFKFITDHLSANDLLPGFVEGYAKIHHDPRRDPPYRLRRLVSARNRPRAPRDRRRRPPDAPRSVAISRGVTQTAGRRRRRIRARHLRRWPSTIRARRPDSPPEHHRRAPQHALTVPAIPLDCSLDCFCQPASGLERFVAVASGTAKSVESPVTKGLSCKGVMPEEGLEPPTRGL